MHRFCLYFQRTSFSVQFSSSVMSDSFQPHGLKHTRLHSPSQTPRACWNSFSLSPWHPTISSSVVPFSSCLQSFPASGCFPMSQLFISGYQNIGASVSASVHPTNIQDWFPLMNQPLVSFIFFFSIFWSLYFCSDLYYFFIPTIFFILFVLLF